VTLNASLSQLSQDDYFVSVGVMYSGEYDVCDVTLSVHPHRQAEKLAWPRWEDVCYTHTKYTLIVS
jgi:hypothetical protein